jgi:hypothetical protein
MVKGVANGLKTRISIVMRRAGSKQLRLFGSLGSSICHGSRYIPQESDEQAVVESFPVPVYH